MNLQTLANIAQIVGVLWALFLGARTIPDLLKGRGTYRTIRTLFIGIAVLIIALIIGNLILPAINKNSQSGQLLYKADWSKGLDGWNQAPGLYGDNWQVIHGQLTNGNNETNNGILLAPVHFQGVTNYLIEVKMKVVSTIAYMSTRMQGNPRLAEASFQPLSGCPFFLIIVRWTNFDHFRSGGTCFTRYPSVNGFSVNKGFINLDSNWYIYSFEANQDKYKFTMDNSIVSQFTEADMQGPQVDTTQAGQVGLAAGGMQIYISSFTVTAL